MDPHRALVRIPASGHLKTTGSPGRYGEAFPQGRALDGQGLHFALAPVQLAAALVGCLESQTLETPRVAPPAVPGPGHARPLRAGRGSRSGDRPLLKWVKPRR